ncbi:MAG: LysE family translocator [Pseudomonadota bacterium]
MPTETLIAFILTDLAFCLVPGPAVMITVSHVLSGGGRNAIGPILGINFGNFIWYALSGLGLMALATTAPTVFALIQYVGAAYLIWLGWKRLKVDPMAPVMTTATANGAIGSNIASGFASGIAVHMANPKALLFYTTILPQFLDASRPIGPQILALVIATIFTETTSLSIYSIIASRGGAIARDAGRSHMLNRIAGVILITVAIALLIVNALPENP